MGVCGSSIGDPEAKARSAEIEKEMRRRKR